MEARAAARAWVDAWERAWPTADPEPLADVYAADATFYSHPFREHQPPLDYAAWAFADQAAAECRFGEPVVAGSGRAAVDWWAAVTTHDGSDETIAGTSLLRFDEHGLVVEQRDVWASEEGRRELPHWAT